MPRPLTASSDTNNLAMPLGYLTHFGHFRQQHMRDNNLAWDVALITFLPKADHDGHRYGLVTLDDPWEVPEQDRPKLGSTRGGSLSFN